VLISKKSAGANGGLATWSEHARPFARHQRKFSVHVSDSGEYVKFTPKCFIVGDEGGCQKDAIRPLILHTSSLPTSYLPTHLYQSHLEPHIYHPPKMVACTRESSPSRATRSQGRLLMIFASAKNHFGLFYIVAGLLVYSRFGTDELRYR
jgi:hypothetical protein